MVLSPQFETSKILYLQTKTVGAPHEPKLVSASLTRLFPVAYTYEAPTKSRAFNCSFNCEWRRPYCFLLLSANLAKCKKVCAFNHRLEIVNKKLESQLIRRMPFFVKDVLQSICALI